MRQDGRSGGEVEPCLPITSGGGANAFRQCGITERGCANTRDPPSHIRQTLWEIGQTPSHIRAPPDEYARGVGRICDPMIMTTERPKIIRVITNDGECRGRIGAALPGMRSYFGKSFTQLVSLELASPTLLPPSRHRRGFIGCPPQALTASARYPVALERVAFNWFHILRL